MVRIEANKSDRPGSPEKAEAILAGAMQEFLQHGYAATSMDKVAAAAGVSKATVYSYFQDKQGLFTALIARFAQEKCAIMQDTESLQGHPRVVLRRLATNMLDTTTHDQQFLAFIRLIIGESGRFPELARVFVSNFEKLGWQFLSQYLAACPQLEIDDPDAIARIFIGALVHYLICQEMMHGKEVAPMEKERIINSLVRLIVRE